MGGRCDLPCDCWKEDADRKIARLLGQTAARRQRASKGWRVWTSGRNATQTMTSSTSTRESCTRQGGFGMVKSESVRGGDSTVHTSFGRAVTLGDAAMETPKCAAWQPERRVVGGQQPTVASFRSVCACARSGESRDRTRVSLAATASPINTRRTLAAHTHCPGRRRS